MPRPKSPLPLAAALLLCAGAAAAGPERSGDAGASAGPIVAPTVNASPTSTPGLGAGLNAPGVSVPGAGITTGMPLPSGPQGASAQAPSAGAAAIGAPSAAELRARAQRLSAESPLPGAADGAGSLEAAASAPGAAGRPARAGAAGNAAADPGAALMHPSAQDEAGGAGRSLSASGALGSAVTELGRARRLEAEGLQGTTAQALDRVFDAAAKNNKRVGDSSAGGAVAGKVLHVRDEVLSEMRVGDTASAHDAPALYEHAMKVADDAAERHVIKPQDAREVDGIVVRHADRGMALRAESILKQAYQAAAAGDEKGVQGALADFARWSKLLGPDVRLLNEADVRADVARSLEAARAGVKGNGVPPRATVHREGEALVAELPRRGAAPAASLPRDFLKRLALDPKAAGAELVPAAALAQAPGLFEGARLVYAYSRRAGRSAASSAASAAAFFTRAAARSLWERLLDLLSAAVGRVFPGRVDLGAGQTLSSYDRGLRRLAALKREPTDEERGMLARKRAGVSVAFVDLSRVTRKTGDLAQAGRAYYELTGDAAALALRGDADFWLARLPQAALDHVDRQLLSAAERGGLKAVVLADLAGGSARLVARAPAPGLAAGLAALGFETELGSNGALRAWTSGPGLAERLDAALDRVSGASAAPAADAPAVARAAEWAAAHPAEARKQAQRLQAEDPALTGFTPAGLVESQGRPLWAESAVRKIGGKLSRVVLLRDLDTRRPLFGRAEPLPAH